MPAPESTNGAIASRCEISTAIEWFDGGRRERAVEEVARRRPGRSRDERHAGQPTDWQPPRRGQPRARRAHRDDLLARERDRDEIVAAGRELRQPDLAVARGDTIGDCARVLGLGHPDHDPRVKRPEAAHERGQRIDGERRQRDEIERARLELPHRAYRVERERALPQHPSGRPLEGPARVGDGYRPADPVEEPHPELGFQPPDALREGRLRDADRVGPGREGTLFDDGEDVLELAQLH